MKTTYAMLIGIMIMSSLVMAASPSRHTDIALNYLEKYPNDPVAQMCKNHQREFVAGAVCTDFTVDLYIVEGGKGYLLTHNWNFQQRVMTQASTDAEKCLAYGITSHLTTDTVWHNNVIPKVIEDTGIPNIPMHPVYELSDELYLQRTDKQTTDIMRNTCVIFEENPRYAQMLQNALGQDSPIKVSERMKVMASLMGTDTFYGGNGAFGGYQDSIFYGIAQAASNTIKTNPTDQIAAGSTAVDRLHTINSDFNTRFTCTDNFCPLEPHGFTKLKEADSKAGTIQLIIITAIIATSAIMLRRK